MRHYIFRFEELFSEVPCLYPMYSYVDFALTIYPFQYGAVRKNLRFWLVMVHEKSVPSRRIEKLMFYRGTKKSRSVPERIVFVTLFSSSPCRPWWRQGAHG